MAKLKVLTFVGTRPEIVKLSRVIAELNAQVNHVLVHTGQNYDYELNEIFFKELELGKPDHFLNAPGKTLAQTIGNVIVRADEVLAQENPDAVLILGDTNSALSVIPAKRRKIPIFHMEAGNRCFDQRVPEETNRKIVDHTSDINLPFTEHARRYLLAEGLRPETVIKTGSPMREVLEHYRTGIESSDVLSRLQLSPGKYFVASSHREENVDSPDNLMSLLGSLNALAQQHKQPVIFSTHPRTRQRLQKLRGKARMNPLVRFLKPLGFFDYIHLQQHAACVLSDSGTLTEESAILNFPAVTLRQAHERPEGMDEGTLIMCGLQREQVLEAVAVVRRHFSEEQRIFEMPADYQALNVSKKVVRLILSYVDYVNRTVWFKPSAPGRKPT